MANRGQRFLGILDSFRKRNARLHASARHARQNTNAVALSVGDNLARMHDHLVVKQVVRAARKHDLGSKGPSAVDVFLPDVNGNVDGVELRDLPDMNVDDGARGDFDFSV